MTTEVRIARIDAAGCMDHADVVLESGTGDFRVRVDAPNARAIMAELAGIPSEFAMLADLMRVVLDALKSPMVRVEVVENGGDPYGRLLFDGDQGLGGVGKLPAGVALMLAARLSLPVFVTAASVPARAATTLPPAFHEFIQGLNFEGQ